MDNSKSPAFAHFIEMELGGAVLADLDDIWYRHFDLALEAFDEILPFMQATIENSEGPFPSVQMGYAHFGSTITGRSHPIAVVGRSREYVFIALHIDLFMHYWALAADLLACPEFMPEIGDVSCEDTSRESRGKYFGFLPFRFKEFELSSIFLGARGPHCPLRLQVSLILRDLMIRSVVNHEIGHLLLGHLDYLKIYGDREHPPHIKNKKKGRLVARDGRLLRALLESEADHYSATQLAAGIGADVRFGIERAVKIRPNLRIALHLIAGALVGYTHVAFDAQDDSNENFGLRKNWEKYPPSSVRLFKSIASFHTTLVDTFGFNPQMVEDALEYSTNQLLTIARSRSEMSRLEEALSYENLAGELNYEGIEVRRLEVGARLDPFRFRPIFGSEEELGLQNIADIGIDSLNEVVIDGRLLGCALTEVLNLRQSGYFDQESEALSLFKLVKSMTSNGDAGRIVLALKIRLDALRELVPKIYESSVDQDIDTAAGKVTRKTLLWAASRHSIICEFINNNIKYRFDADGFWRSIVKD